MIYKKVLQKDQKQTKTDQSVKNVKGGAKKHKTEDHVHCGLGYLLEGL
jgi:hypothetical protein